MMTINLTNKSENIRMRPVAARSGGQVERLLVQEYGGQTFNPVQAWLTGPRADKRPSISIDQGYGVPAERVYDAFLDPGTAGKWLFATAAHQMARVEIDPRVGGSYSFADREDDREVVHAGVYLELVRPRRLVFTLSVEGHPQAVTRVTTDIIPLAQRCALTLTHENLPSDRARYMEARWTGMLYGLGLILEQGAEVD